MSDSDGELLRRYAQTRAEEAFAELVRRRLSLVYSVALRQCAGDVQLASEVTQRVFADLARKAAVLVKGVSLADGFTAVLDSRHRTRYAPSAAGGRVKKKRPL